ncbi:MAG: tetratricopeptide repeat protein, partial [Nitrospira sp.]|nr:tetratricopeptide repeat protein [Nitrospira sp.]
MGQRPLQWRFAWVCFLGASVMVGLSFSSLVDAQDKRLFVAQPAAPLNTQPVQDSISLWLRKGQALRASGDLRAGIEAFRRAIALQPRHAEAHYLLGVALEEAYDVDGALAEFETVAELAPNHLNGQFRLGV